jgi:RHS repeat-associated protein
VPFRFSRVFRPKYPVLAFCELGPCESTPQPYPCAQSLLNSSPYSPCLTASAPRFCSHAPLAILSSNLPRYIFYYFADQLGSTRTITTGSSTFGQVVAQQGTFPYGESWYSTGSGAPDKFLFTSYARDSESGLDYAMARYYDSGLGRFCSADPVSGSPGDPQTWNRYAYVRNDPVNLTDPSGQHWFFDFIKFLVEALAALNGVPPFLDLGTIGMGGGTPPFIDNGPLSDSSATLNSIYHPIDPRQFGIEDFTVNRNIDTFKDLLYTVYGDDITDCLKSIFGSKFASKHPQTLENSPAIDVSQTGAQLAKKVNWSGVAPGTDRSKVQGTSDPHKGPYGTVDIAKEDWQNPGGWQDLQGTYVHELGNILADRYFHNPSRFGNKEGIGQVKDKDTGANLEMCVFKRVNF